MSRSKPCPYNCPGHRSSFGHRSSDGGIMRCMNPFILVVTLIIVLLAGCSQPVITPESTSTHPAKISLYRTSTPSPTSSPIPTHLATIPVTPAPTATPFTHVIKKDDTMLGIALIYDVKLEELLASNPEIDPHFMTVGQTLVIPLQSADPAESAPPTPVPILLDAPVCYDTAEGGVWCFVTAVNEQENALENLSALV
ncbi:MAG: LysM domain-containing protein, partial [Chloroflexi bacterium]